MATISARVDDDLKARAEEIAESIGVPLSSVVNIFLRRFVLENGFPFDVKAPEAAVRAYEPAALEAAFKRAVANKNGPIDPDNFTYFDPETQKPVTVSIR